MKTVTDPYTGEITEYTDDEFMEAKLNLLSTWDEAKKAMTAAAIIEKKAREEYVALVGNPAKVKGTEYDTLENGWRCKITKSLYYSFKKLDNTNKINVEAINDALREIADTVEDGAEVAGELVRWVPSLAVGPYEKLSAKAKSIINKVVISGKTSVAIELVPPKESK